MPGRGQRRTLVAPVAAALALGTVLAAGSAAVRPDLAAAAAPLPIADIQGTGATTPYQGKQVTTTPSVVTAVYGQEATAELGGFVIQTPGTGGRRSLSSASDAVFVYLDQRRFPVQIGDRVTVTGTAGEFRGLTQIVATDVTKIAGEYRPVRPVTGPPRAPGHRRRQSRPPSAAAR